MESDIFVVTCVPLLNTFVQCYWEALNLRLLLHRIRQAGGIVVRISMISTRWKSSDA